MAMAFQRTMLLMRRSISRLPGYGTCSSGLMVLMYGVFAVNGRRTPDFLGVDAELTKQAADARRPSMLQNIVQRIEPLAGFEGFELGGIGRSGISHGRAKPSLYVRASRLGNQTILAGWGAN